VIMSTIQRIDSVGMRCPHPVLILGNETTKTPPGTVVEIVGDCPTFEKDVRQFCDRRGRTVLAVLGMAPKLTIQIQF
jgi:tRNA 2-thiouridine synthesizing protein A